MGSEDDAPLQDLITPKLFFYTEDEQLHSAMFPPQWYEAMKDHLVEPVNYEEPPFHEVRV